MRPEDVRAIVERVPFVPFRIQLSSGDHIDITRSHRVAVMQTQIFVALSGDRWKFIPLHHVASVETLRAA